MRKWRICMVLFGLLLSAPALAQGAPKAVVPEPSHSFGQVLEGAVVTHDFVIRNQGDAPLFIGKISSE